MPLNYLFKGPVSKQCNYELGFRYNYGGHGLAFNIFPFTIEAAQSWEGGVRVHIFCLGAEIRGDFKFIIYLSSNALMPDSFFECPAVEITLALWAQFSHLYTMNVVGCLFSKCGLKPYDFISTVFSPRELAMNKVEIMSPSINLSPT